jgi:hypothetical protein
MVVEFGEDYIVGQSRAAWAATGQTKNQNEC